MDQSLSIINKHGKLTLDGDGNFNLASLSATIQGLNYLNLESYSELEMHTYSGTLAIYNETGNISISTTANSNPSLILSAIYTDPNTQDITAGGISLLSGTSGLSSNSVGNTIITANNTIFDVAHSLAITTGDVIEFNTDNFNLVSGDSINLFSSTGNVNIGIDLDTPTLTLVDGNLLINHADNSMDRQVHIQVSAPSNSKPEYNGILISSTSNTTAPDIEFLNTSNTALSIGLQPTNSNISVYQTFIAYQSDTLIIPGGNTFLFSPATDLNRRIYKHSTDSNDTITGFTRIIVGISDPDLFSATLATATILAQYTQNSRELQELQQQYTLIIDSINNADGAPDTFRWNSTNYTGATPYIPCSLSDILLHSSVNIQFTQSTGFQLGQQFTFYTKIAAIVTTPVVDDTAPEYISTLQSEYAYISTSHPTDIVIRSNNTEKLRITHDSGIKLNQRAAATATGARYGNSTIAATAAFSIDSNYNRDMQVNTNYQQHQMTPQLYSMNGGSSGSGGSGGYIIAWASADPDIPVYNILAQYYSADGSPTYPPVLNTGPHPPDWHAGTNLVLATLTTGTFSLATHKTSNAFLTTWLTQVAPDTYHLISRISGQSQEILIAELSESTSNINTDSLYNGNYIIVWTDAVTNNAYYALLNAQGVLLSLVDDFNTTPNIHSAQVTAVLNSSSDSSFIISYMADLILPYIGAQILFRISNSATATDEQILIHQTHENTPITTISTIAHAVAAIPNSNSFMIAYSQNYTPNTNYYNTGDNLLSISTNTSAVIDTLASEFPLQLPVLNYSGLFTIGEELAIDSSVTDVGTLILKINNVIYNSPISATLYLASGAKCISTNYYTHSQLVPGVSALNYSLDINQCVLYTTPSEDAAAYSLDIAINDDADALICWNSGTNSTNTHSFYQLLHNTTEPDGSDTSAVLVYPHELLLTNSSSTAAMAPHVTNIKNANGLETGWAFTWQSTDFHAGGIFTKLIPTTDGVLADFNQQRMTITHAGAVTINCTTACDDNTNSLRINHNSNPILHIHTNSNYITTSDNHSFNSANSEINPLYTNSTGNSNIIFSCGSSASSSNAAAAEATLATITAGHSSNYNSITPNLDSLIAYYPMDELATLTLINNAPHSRGSNITTAHSNFILQHFTPFAAEHCKVPGIINSALEFNGSDNYAIYVPTNYIPLNTLTSESNNMSINLWVKIPTGIPAAAHYTILTNGTQFDQPGSHFELYCISQSLPDLNIAIKISSSSGIHSTLSGYTLVVNDNQWHNVGVSLHKTGGGNGELALYFDGVRIATDVIPGPFDSGSLVNNNTVYLGVDGTTTLEHYFRGTMDELRIYSTALSPAEFATLYKYGNRALTHGQLAFNCNSSNSASNTSVSSTNNTIVFDETGAIKNIHAKPHNASVLQGITLYTSSSNTALTISPTPVNVPLVHTGDILQLHNGDARASYTVLTAATIDDNDGSTDLSIITVDRPTYAGIGIGGSHTNAVVLPTIQRWVTENDSFVAAFDYNGCLNIGQPAFTHSLLQLTGNATVLPTMSLVQTSPNSNSNIKFLNNSGLTLAAITTVPSYLDDAVSGDIIFTVNNSEQHIAKLSTRGYLSVGGISPLGRAHFTESDPELPGRLLLESRFIHSSSGGGGDGAVYNESSELLFIGTQSLTETNNITSNSLAKIVGSNDGINNMPDGRIDFYTNNSDYHSGGHYLEKALSITKQQYIGINITQPTNILEVAPRLSLEPTAIAASSSVAPNVIQLQLSNNLFAGLSAAQLLQLASGAVVIENAAVERYSVIEVINSDTLNISCDNLDAVAVDFFASNAISIHYAGLSVTPMGFIGHNTAAPTSYTHLNGSVSYAIKHISSATYTADDSDYTIIANSDSNIITVYLPNNITEIRGRVYVIKRVGANTVGISGNGFLIDGAASATLTANYESVRVQCDGISDWWVV
jgi:hypothetical protein